MITINDVGVFFCPPLKDDYDKFVYAKWVGGLKCEFDIKEVTEYKLIGENDFTEIEITSDQLTFNPMYLEFKGEKDYTFNKYQYDRVQIREEHRNDRYRLNRIIDDYYIKEDEYLKREEE